jgi:hypothetical protein
MPRGDPGGDLAGLRHPAGRPGSYPPLPPPTLRRSRSSSRRVAFRISVARPVRYGGSTPSPGPLVPDPIPPVRTVPAGLVVAGTRPSAEAIRPSGHARAEPASSSCQGCAAGRAGTSTRAPGWNLHQGSRVTNTPARAHNLRKSRSSTDATYATLALQAGVHAKVMPENLGHANIGVTLDTYSHAIPSLQESAAETVAALMFGGS